MIFIGENLHIISKSVKNAFINKDENFIKELLIAQKDVECVDLNIGPQSGIYEWLVPFVMKNYSGTISFDTTNANEIETGLNIFKNCENCFINSASKNKDRFEKMSDLALKYNCNLILLTMDNGIPKTADERLEIAIEMYENATEKGLNPQKLYFDPLILPINVAQNQAMESINTLRMIKETFEIPPKTLIGLSNISNGIPKEIKSIINRVFACFTSACELDSMIVNAKDTELIRIVKMLKIQAPQDETDELYIKIFNTIKNFGEIDDIEYNVNSEEQQKIIKTCQVLSGQKIYSNNFTQV